MRSVALVFGVLLLAACDLPFGLGQPTTRELENGAAASLRSNFEMKGTFVEDSVAWKLDLQQAGTTRHLVLASDKVSLEAIFTERDLYFRGQQFLTTTLGTGAHAQELARAAGNSWWKGVRTGDLPNLVELTDSTAFSEAFLGSAASSRNDAATVDGTPAVELSGPRGRVFIAAASPHVLLHLLTPAGVTVDGLTNIDFGYGSFGTDFKLGPPADVVDFSSLSTLPPLYSVVSVDTSGCQSPCVVTATVRNVGGLQPAAGPSKVTFTMTDPVSGQPVGSCTTQVRPDVAFNQARVVGCEIVLLSETVPEGATVTATATNPGRAG